VPKVHPGTFSAQRQGLHSLMLGFPKCGARLLVFSGPNDSLLTERDVQLIYFVNFYLFIKRIISLYNLYLF